MKMCHGLVYTEPIETTKTYIRIVSNKTRFEHTEELFNS